MKKIYVKIVVVLLAFVMALGLCACGDDTVKPDDKDPDKDPGKDPVTEVKVGEVMSGAIDKLTEGGFTVMADGKIVLPSVTFKAVNVTAAVRKTVAGYDFRTMGKLTEESGEDKDEMSFDFVKVGDNIYAKTTGDVYKGKSIDKQAMDGVLQAIGKLKDYTGKLGGTLDKKTDGYTYSKTFDANKYINAAIEFIKTNKDVTVGRLIADMLGTATDKVTPEDVAAMINGYIDKDPTVKSLVDDIQKALKKFYPSIDLESMVNAYAAQRKLTPEAIYAMAGGAESGLTEPKAGDTVYGYAMTAFGEMKVMPLVVKLLQQMELPVESVVDVKKEITSLLTSEELTVGNIYDMVMGEFLGNNDIFNMFVYMTADDNVLGDIKGSVEQNIFGLGMLDKLTFGKNAVTVDFTFDKEKAFSAIKVTVDINVNYKNGDVEGALVRVKADLEIGFAYGEVTVTVPDKVVMENEGTENQPPVIVPDDQQTENAA